MLTWLVERQSSKLCNSPWPSLQNYITMFTGAGAQLTRKWISWTLAPSLVPRLDRCERRVKAGRFGQDMWGDTLWRSGGCRLPQGHHTAIRHHSHGNGGLFVRDLASYGKCSVDQDQDAHMNEYCGNRPTTNNKEASRNALNKLTLACMQHPWCPWMPCLDTALARKYTISLDTVCRLCGEQHPLEHYSASCHMTKSPRLHVSLLSH